MVSLVAGAEGLGLACRSVGASASQRSPPETRTPRHAVWESSHLVKKVKQNKEIREFRPKLTVF